jgi:hypothetical protein
MISAVVNVFIILDEKIFKIYIYYKKLYLKYFFILVFKLLNLIKIIIIKKNYFFFKKLIL